MSDDEFEIQLQQEAEEKAKKEKLNSGTQKVDPDGTAYDWDEEKKAWFPRVDEDFIARYQMSYGTENPSTDSSETNSGNIPPSSSDPAYAEWYSKYYSNYDGTGNPIDTNTKEYRDWYNYYYGDESKTDVTADIKENNSKSSESVGKKEKEDTKDEHSDEPPEKKQCKEAGKEGETNSSTDNNSQQRYQEYYEYYYQQYGQYPTPPSKQEENSSSKDNNKPQLDPSHPDYWNQYHSMELTESAATVNKPNTEAKSRSKDSKGDGKKGKKKKVAPQPVVPPSWFEMEDTKNTTVYVAGLPPDFTEEKLVTLMNRCGLIMYDPRSKKPKAKLYKDKDGNAKGDGRCCYIKKESVDLALQFLDGSDVDGYKISVEVAKFELKGEYDPTKKRKKLSNNEKKKFKEKQAKLFDWRPDKPRGVRGKHEKVVIIKNFFDSKDFETNPALINELSQDLRDECQQYGEVKKVTIYDRHPDGVASVAFKEPEQADVCIAALDRRYFAGNRLLAETWDGQSKFEVEETEEQRQERLKKWEKYLTGDQPSKTNPGTEDKASKAQPEDQGDKADSGEQGNMADSVEQGNKLSPGKVEQGNTASSVREEPASQTVEEGAVQGIDTDMEGLLVST